LFTKKEFKYICEEKINGELFFLSEKNSIAFFLLSFIRQNFIQHVFNKKTRVERRKGDEEERERVRVAHRAERIKMAGSYGIRRVCNVE
jgi:hypothetical protein